MREKERHVQFLVCSSLIERTFSKHKLSERKSQLPGRFPDESESNI